MIYRGDVVVRVSVDDVGDGTIDIYVSTSRRNGTYTLAADEVPHSGNGDGFVGTSSITFSAVAGSDVYIDIRQGNQSLDHGEAFLNGFDLTLVPEPATLSLLGLGALAMLRRRKQP